MADSDNDGLTDGEEAGAPITKNDTSPTYSGISNPGSKDTDDDGVRDGDEYVLGTDPRSGHTDNDGQPDEEELDFGSDPLSSTNQTATPTRTGRKGSAGRPP